MKPSFASFNRLVIPMSAVLAMSTMLESCAPSADGRTTQAQGTGIGALLGAGAGAIIGNQSGHAGQGALIGALVGGAGGFAYGTYVAKKKANYKNAEDWLDASISDAEKKRSSAIAYNNKLDGRLAQLQSEIRMAKAANDRSKLSSLKSTIEKEKAAAVKESGNYTKFVQSQESEIHSSGVGNSSKMQKLQSETTGIQSQATGINRRVERYAALDSQIDI